MHNLTLSSAKRKAGKGFALAAIVTLGLFSIIGTGGGGGGGNSLTTGCPATGKVYVVNSGGDTVSVIDASKDSVCKTINVGNNPGIWVLDDVGNRLYVHNKDDDTVMVINTADDSVVATVGVGDRPTATALDSTRNYLYVANQGDNTVSVIDTTTNTLHPTSGTIAVGSAPHKVKANETTGMAYVLMDTRDVYVIDGSNLAAAPAVVALGTNPTLGRLTIKETANKVYVSRDSGGGGRVSVIDGANAVTNINVGNEPRRMSMDDSETNLYVANRVDNTVSKIDDTDTVVSTYTGGNGVGGVAINSSTNRLYVSNKQGDTVSVFDTTTDTQVGNEISVGDNPVNFGISEARNKIYVSNRGATGMGNTVSVIDGASNTVTATITVGTRPTAIRVLE